MCSGAGTRRVFADRDHEIVAELSRQDPVFVGVLPFQREAACCRRAGVPFGKLPCFVFGLKERSSARPRARIEDALPVLRHAWYRVTHP